MCQALILLVTQWTSASPNEESVLSAKAASWFPLHHNPIFSDPFPHTCISIWKHGKNQLCLVYFTGHNLYFILQKHWELNLDLEKRQQGQALKVLPLQGVYPRQREVSLMQGWEGLLPSAKTTQNIGFFCADIIGICLNVPSWLGFHSFPVNAFTLTEATLGGWEVQFILKFIHRIKLWVWFSEIMALQLQQMKFSSRTEQVLQVIYTEHKPRT